MRGGLRGGTYEKEGECCVWTWLLRGGAKHARTFDISKNCEQCALCRLCLHLKLPMAGNCSTRSVSRAMKRIAGDIHHMPAHTVRMRANRTPRARCQNERFDSLLQHGRRRVQDEEGRKLTVVGDRKGRSCRSMV